MKYYLIAGEASGDLHASNLMKGLKKFDRKAEFRFFGGDKMSETGGRLVKHYREMAFMGLVDVLGNLRVIKKNIDHCKRDILDWQPDLIILVDYAGFNLRIAEFTKSRNLKVFYYISPKVWVWRKSRIEKLKRFTDRLFVIFPFEKEFFRENGMNVEYFGNPLTDAIQNFSDNFEGEKAFREQNMLDNRPVVALLAGSRKQEISYCLPEMLKVIKGMNDYQFVVAGAPSLDPEFYAPYLGRDIKMVYNQTYELLSISYAAIVTSGTATLETAMFKVPQLVLYKTNPVNYHLGKLIVKYTFFSLVNLIAGYEVVREFLQYNLNANIKNELNRILENENYRKKMLSEYQKISDKLGTPGTSERIAGRMSEIMNAQ